MVGCVHGCMCARLDVCTVACVHGWMCARLDVCTVGCVHGWMCAWLHVCTVGCVHGWICVHDCMCARLDVCTVAVFCIVYIYSCQVHMLSNCCCSLAAAAECGCNGRGYCFTTVGEDGSWMHSCNCSSPYYGERCQYGKIKYL